ncbi:DNA cytosine methyltransferase [Streptacidiphilus carbonis]|uniref:DNA cytosine methyltransferase n=1 Tax=Streptacidiphilus carbonis TaxID=105422 RepID=UPI0005AAEB73|nr:DNA cytosine methyltransferase [Streptacidiphilus carbonis]
MNHTTAEPTGVTIDLFAGPGGWSEGIRRHLGITDIGIEWDRSACLTRHAAGHLTIQADVATYPTRHMAHLLRGLIASPPCTLFSSAGKGTGRRVIDLLADGIRRLFRGDDCRGEVIAAIHPVALAELREANAKKAPEKQRTDTQLEAAAGTDAACAALVMEPARWIAELLAADGILEWVALEQVPAVQPLWDVYAEELRRLGWSAWTGKLNSADYGVPQTRTRAILIASRTRTVQPPAATHYDPRRENALADIGQDSLFAPELPRWVSMAQALGWAAEQTVNTRGDRKTSGGNEFSADRPSWALTEKTRSWILHTNRGHFRADGERQLVNPESQPAPTVTTKTGEQWTLRNGNQPRAAVREADEPAPTMTFGNNAARVEWVLRNNTNANACVRAMDEPAGTLFFGHRGNDVSWVLRSGQSVAGEGRAERSQDEPAVTITGRADLCAWTQERPATTVCATNRIAPPGHRDRDPGGESQFASPETVRITVQEAAVPQSFPGDYPWQGTRTKQFEQVGNAVPPLLAAHVASAASGIPMPA